MAETDDGCGVPEGARGDNVLVAGMTRRYRQKFRNEFRPRQN